MSFNVNEYTIEVRTFRAENGAQTDYETFTVLGQNDEHIPNKHLGLKPLYTHPDFRGMTIYFGDEIHRFYRF